MHFEDCPRGCPPPRIELGAQASGRTLGKALTKARVRGFVDYELQGAALAGHGDSIAGARSGCTPYQGVCIYRAEARGTSTILAGCRPVSSRSPQSSRSVEAASPRGASLWSVSRWRSHKAAYRETMCNNPWNTEQPCGANPHAAIEKTHRNAHSRWPWRNDRNPRHRGRVRLRRGALYRS